MTIIAERGLFVRLLVQSGKFDAQDAEVLADAIDAATREPATKADLDHAVLGLRADLDGVKAELKSDIALLSQRIDGFDLKLNSAVDKLLVRLGGLMIALIGLLFAALRSSAP